MNANLPKQNTGYLYRMPYPSIEEVVDEMFAT